MTSERRILQTASTLILATALHLSQPQNSVEAQTCQLDGNIIEVTQPGGVKLRSEATTKSKIVAKLPKGEDVSLMEKVEGQSLKINGQISNWWSRVKTGNCKEGFVHSSLLGIGGEINQQPVVESQPGVKAGGILSCLDITIESANYIPWSGRGGIISTSKGINALNNIPGRAGQWNDYNSATPFDHFTYPQNGNWYAVLKLYGAAGDKSVEKQVWTWHGNGESELLVWVFRSMNANADGNGNHNGTHDFCWWGGVDKATWDSATSRR